MDKQSRQGNTISSFYYGQVQTYKAVCLGMPQVHLFFFDIIKKILKKNLTKQKAKKMLVTNGCLQKIENEKKEKEGTKKQNNFGDLIVRVELKYYKYINN